MALSNRRLSGISVHHIIATAFAIVITTRASLGNKIETDKRQIWITKRDAYPNQNHVQVQCATRNMCIIVDRDWMEQEWGVRSIEQVMLRVRCDDSITVNATHVTLCTNDGKMSSCGTSLKQNDTHVTFENDLLILPVPNDSSQATFAGLIKASLPWKCVYPMNLLVGVDFVPQISKVTVFLDKKSGYGKFEATMYLYKDDQYRTTYQGTPKLEITDRLRLKVKLLKGPKNAKIQVMECWGTPLPVPEETKLSYLLIEDFCAAPSAISANVRILNNGNSHDVLWESNVFRFIKYNEVYIHCQVRVCFDGPTCVKSCPAPGARRKRRDTDVTGAILSLGPVTLQDRKEYNEGMDDDNKSLKKQGEVNSDNSRENSTILGMPRNVVYIIIAVLAIVCVSLMIGVFVGLRKRAQRLAIQNDKSYWERQAAARHRLSARFTLSNYPPFEIPMSVPNTISGSGRI